MFNLMQSSLDDFGTALEQFTQNEIDVSNTIMCIVDKSTILLSSIAEAAPEAFQKAEEKTKRQLVILILTFFNRYLSTESLQKCPTALPILRVYASLATILDDDEDLALFTDPNLLYFDNIFEQIGEILDESEAFSRFIDRVNAHKAAIEIDIPLEDTPPEFTDCITYDILRDPILLPTGTNVSKYTFERLSMTNCVDPLKQIVFDPKDAKPNTELKSRIESWIRDYRERHSG